MKVIRGTGNSGDLLITNQLLYAVLGSTSLRQTFTRSKSLRLGQKLEAESELLRPVFGKRLHFG